MSGAGGGHKRRGWQLCLSTAVWLGVAAPAHAQAAATERSPARDDVQAAESAQSAFEQSSFSWRAHVTDEATLEQPNTSSPFAAAGRGAALLGSNALVAAGDGTWDWQRRVKLGAGLLLIAPSDDHPELRVREAYARTSVLPWLDVEAGKRLLRWGTGYAFTPTGVLDPPRDATDPQDRLGLNEGMLLVRADAFAGSTAVTIAAAAPRLDRPHPATADTPHRLLAMRVRTTITGVEVAGVASAADNQRLSVGANFTHVVGRQLEYHGELLLHDDQSTWRERLAPHEPRERRVSGLLGFQYTFDLGLNTIVEYYHDGNGLTSTMWSRLFDGALDAQREHAALPALAAAGAGTLNRPTRQNFLFLRGSRANTDGIILPDLITLVSLDDGGLTLVPTLRLAPTRHLQLYVRALLLTGRSRSAEGSAPVASTISTGLTVLF